MPSTAHNGSKQPFAAKCNDFEDIQAKSSQVVYFAL